jgi:hypothetical protein
VWQDRLTGADHPGRHEEAAAAMSQCKHPDCTAQKSDRGRCIHHGGQAYAYCLLRYISIVVRCLAFIGAWAVGVTQPHELDKYCTYKSNA